MKAVIPSLVLVIAQATDRELARMVEYLKAENRILRSKLPKRISVTPRDRQTLLKFGKKLGGKIRALITIVTPRTCLRWVGGDSPTNRRPGKPGRPRTKEEVRESVLKLARKNA
jgi:putative transposase